MKFKITQEQIERLEHYQRMFELNANEIEKLCNEEKDDIAYGFELGKIHSNLRDCQFGIMQLISELREI